MPGGPRPRWPEPWSLDRGTARKCTDKAEAAGLGPFQEPVHRLVEVEELGVSVGMGGVFLLLGGACSEQLRDFKIRPTTSSGVRRGERTNDNEMAAPALFDRRKQFGQI